MPSLLAVAGARIDIDGVPACEGLTFETTGDRAVVLGAPRALFEAVSGRRPVVSGSVAVRGAAPSPKACAAAPLDPALPLAWKSLEFVRWNARLGGHADPKKAATEAMQRLKLDAYAKSAIANLPPHAKRALVVAGALATGAPVVAMEDPTGGLPEELAQSLAQAIADAFDTAPWLLFAPQLAATSALALRADEMIVVSGARGISQGRTSRFVARVSGSPEALAEKLGERGVAATVDGSRLTFDLGQALTTRDLFGLAQAACVTVIELHPARVIS